MRQTIQELVAAIKQQQRSKSATNQRVFEQIQTKTKQPKLLAKSQVQPCFSPKLSTIFSF
jgi:hypothetical protein